MYVGGGFDGDVYMSGITCVNTGLYACIQIMFKNGGFCRSLCVFYGNGAHVVPLQFQEFVKSLSYFRYGYSLYIFFSAHDYGLIVRKENLKQKTSKLINRMSKCTYIFIFKIANLAYITNAIMFNELSLPDTVRGNMPKLGFFLNWASLNFHISKLLRMLKITRQFHFMPNT